MIPAFDSSDKLENLVTRFLISTGFLMPIYQGKVCAYPEDSPHFHISGSEGAVWVSISRTELSFYMAVLCVCVLTSVLNGVISLVKR